MKEIMAYHLKTICHGLVVLMPACMSPKPKVEGSSLSWIPLCGWPGYYINVQCCGGLSMVLLQLKDPLEQFVKRKKFLPCLRFLSRSNMTT